MNISIYRKECEMSEPQTDSETLPCGHQVEDSLFDMRSGDRRLITIPPVVNADVPVNLPGAVWCVQGCGWVALTSQQFVDLTALRVLSRIEITK